MTTTVPRAEPSDEAEKEPQPDDRCRRLLVGAALTGLFVLITLVMAFPSVTKWRTATPGDFGDSFLIQWLLRWGVHGLFGSDSVFSPNIFWPARDTLLWSDTELAAAVPGGLLAGIVGWTAAYNVLYVSGWVISLAATYALARWLGASREGSVLAGLVFTFAAVRLGHYGHFQLQFAYFVPLVLWLLLRFLDERRWWQAAAIGASCAAVFLNAVYVAVVLVPTVLIVAGGWLIATRFRDLRRYLPGLLVAGAVMLALCGPVVRAYTNQDDFLRREYIEDHAITFSDLLSPPEGSWLYQGLLRWTDSPFENRVFPGFSAIAVAIAGCVALAVARRRGNARRRGLVLILVAGAVVLALCFGKFEVIAGRAVPLPYRFLAGLPGFESIRALGRFFVVPLLALGLLVAVGYDWLVRNRSTAARIALATALGLVLLAEYRAAIVMSPRIDDNPDLTAVNSALDRLPDGPVVELPMGDSRDPSWAYVEAPRMVLSSIDWKPRVNGYSGYSPLGYETTIDAFNSLDDGPPATPEVLALLDRFGIRYLVIRTAPPTGDDPRGVSFIDDAAADRIVAALPPERVEAVSRERGARLVQLHPPPAATP